jgi:hypothetical protein
MCIMCQQAYMHLNCCDLQSDQASMHSPPPCRILYSLDSYSSCGCLVLMVSCGANGCQQVRACHCMCAVCGKADRWWCLTSLIATSSPVWMLVPASQHIGSQFCSATDL